MRRGQSKSWQTRVLRRSSALEWIDVRAQQSSTSISAVTSGTSACGASSRPHISLNLLGSLKVVGPVLSLVGGLIGIIIGVGISLVVPSMLGWPTLVSQLAILGSVIFSAAVGIFFGYYPARKAAALDPIDALRYE